MNKIFLILFLISPSLAFSSNLNLPKIKGFNIVEKFKGDINDDKIEDMVVLYQGNNLQKIIKNKEDNLGSPEFNENERKIVVYLNKNNQLIKLAENPIAPEGSIESPCISDPYSGVVIKKNILQIIFNHWSSCGGWGTSLSSYIFKLDLTSNKLRLIGKEYSSFMRNTGEKEVISTNYLTGKEKTIVGLNEFEKTTEKPNVKWKNLDSNPILYFGNINFNH